MPTNETCSSTTSKLSGLRYFGLKNDTIRNARTKTNSRLPVRNVANRVKGCSEAWGSSSALRSGGLPETHPSHARYHLLASDLVSRCVQAQATETQRHDPVSYGKYVVEVVTDDDDRNPLGGYAANQVEGGSGLAHSQGRRGFIELNQPVGANCGARDCDRLALSSGKATDRRFQVRQLNAQFLYVPARLVARASGVEHGERAHPIPHRLLPQHHVGGSPKVVAQK